MSTTPSTPDPSQKEKICSIHQDRPVLFACFSARCAQPFLCRTCYKEHSSDHENEIYELSSVQRIKDRFEIIEDEKDDIVTQRQDINTQKDQIVSQSKEFIITMMDKIANDIQDKKQQLLRQLSEYANTEKDDTTKDLFSRLESDIKTIEDFHLGEDLFENVTQIKILNEEMLPAAKNLIKEAEEVLSTWKLDSSKLDLYEKELSYLLGNPQLMDFLYNMPFKSLTQLDIPDSLKTVHLNLGITKTDTFREKILKLQEDNARLTKELEDSVQVIDQYKLDNSQLKNQVSILSKENETLKTQTLNLSAQVTNLEKEKITLQNGLDTLKEKNELEKKQRQGQASLSEENQTLKAQAKTLSAQIKTLEQQKASFKDILIALLKKGGCGTINVGNRSWYYCKGIENGCTSSGKVWGSNPYTSDSDACCAARHSGVINAGGGIASRELEGPLSSFSGTTQNGVPTYNYGYYGSTHHYSSI